MIGQTTVVRSMPNAIGAERAAIALRDEARLLDHFARGERARWRDHELRWDGNSLGVSLRTSSASMRIDGDRIELAVSFRGARSVKARVMRPVIERELDAALHARFGRPCTPKPHKVFCVGFQRTGTTSMIEALRSLGYFGIHNAPWLLTDVQVGRDRFDLVDEYDAVADNPFPMVFRELDEAHPGSKFILTVRDVDAWLASARYLVEEWAPGFAMERFIYGVDGFDADVYRQRYLRHIDEVIDHFAGRPDSLLVVDVTQGDPWPAICRFLGEDLPRPPFPRAGRSCELVSDGASWA